MLRKWSKLLNLPKQLPIPNMQSIASQTNLSGKNVLLRTDFNVPAGADGIVDPAESFRIKVTLDTIRFLTGQGAKVIIISHLGSDGQQSLQPVYNFLNKIISLKFIPNLIGESVASEVSALQNGEVIMLENLRSHPGEITNDMDFAKTLASYADIYVNEAFAVSHRSHASLVSIPVFLPSYAGLHLVKEVKAMRSLLNPQKPFVVIMGGLKFATKLPLIKKFSKQADFVFVGGALANAIFHARGYEIGVSAYDEQTELSSILNSPNISTPKEVITQNNKIKFANQLDPNDKIVDIAQSSLDRWRNTLENAGTILWNGPLGYYETSNTSGTKYLLEILANCPGKKIVGGGDSVLLVNELKMTSVFDFISTGGGAMLEFLDKGSLPAIDALISQ